MAGPVKITVDTTDAKRNLAALDAQTEKTLKTSLSVARRGLLLMGLFTAQAKDAVTKGLMMMGQAALIAAETTLAIATAEATTIVGAINAALGYAAAAALFVQSAQILAFGKSAEAQFDALDRGVQAANIVFAGW